MKKIVSLLLVLVMALSLAACNNQPAETTGTTETTAPVVEGPASAEEILLNIWALYGEDEKFAVVGGNPDNMYMEGPAAYNAEAFGNLTFSHLIPEAEIASLEEAATVVHMMNANSFTAAAVKLTAGTDVAAFAATMQNAIQTNPWMCGFPERMIIVDMGGNYVLFAYGINDAMTPFCTKLATAYPAVTTLYDEAIA